MRPASKTWRLLAVFVIALTVRLVYNLYIAQHRILDVGDSFYYLTGGGLLAKLVRESQSADAFFSQLCSAAKFVPGGFKSFSSLGLSDRLLIDGPIYPSYLAAIFLITGKTLEATALNANQLAFGLANSVTDALLAAAIAFMGETAFGVIAGLLAGLFWCFYIPAVINTQQCYGEPVVALLLTLFLAALFYQTKYCAGAASADPPVCENATQPSCKKKPLMLSLVVGILAGLVMLSKPLFVILPALLLALHLIFLSFSGQLRKQPLRLTTLLLGVCLVLGPWLIYTRTISGAMQLMVNRAPGYNLYIGNYLPTDGWKIWPVVPGIPDSAAGACTFIDSEIERKPWAMTSLLLRKIPRLWTGVWNDFHTSCFGINYILQNVFQSVYLLLACIGLAVLFAGRLRKVRSFSFAAAATLAYAVAFHFVYAFFEPVPRYAFTAMPMVLTLAAGGIVAFFQALWPMPRRLRLRTLLRVLFLCLFVAVIATAHALKMPVFYSLASVVKDPVFLRNLCGYSLCLIFLLIGLGFIRALVRVKISGPLFYAVLAKCSILAGLIALAGALGDPTYLEYSAKITPKIFSSIVVKLDLPDLGKSVPPRLYLLVDAQAESGAPDLSLLINEKRTSTFALPMYELTGASRDIPTLINLQGRMMDVDQRTFRQWWAYPVDSSLFHFGGENVIALFPVKNIKVFGDYFPPQADTAGGETGLFPSLASFSWSKGFLTADSRDPRPYEETYFRGKTKVSWLTYGSGQYGKGALRVRLAVPMPTTAMGEPGAGAAAATPTEPIYLLNQPEEKQIFGHFPLVFASPELALPGQLAPSSILHMHAQMRRNNPNVPATMALSLDFAPDKPAYSSIWQPSCLRLKNEWEEFDFKTVLPSTTAGWTNLKAHLLLSPYPGDRLYLHRKEALKDSIFVRNLKIEIMPPAIPGAGVASALRLM